MKKLTDSFCLNNGNSIPCVGFGTWKAPSGEIVINAVRSAVSAGYRHIDTAAVYKNEPSVGAAVASCGVDRSELFITSKVWNTCRGYDKTMSAFESTMSDLKLDYLDLYLVHWPAARGDMREWAKLNASTWSAMEELCRAGKIKNIGVSNFLPHHLRPLMDTAEIMPAVNQIEFHPGMLQEETREFCRENSILVEAWSPMGNGKMLDNPALMEIGKKYGKSAAQICVKWCLQHGVLPLPKSVTPSRIIENADIFDFEISDEDMLIIDGLENTGYSGLHPDKVDF